MFKQVVSVRILKELINEENITLVTEYFFSLMVKSLNVSLQDKNKHLQPSMR
jgi:hypothetical protein